jgi:hypothetical protein
MIRCLAAPAFGTGRHLQTFNINLMHLRHIGGGGDMATCETCGNEYDKTFQVTMSGKAHTFDSFECAIHALAPTCDHCGIRIVGHGLEKGGTFYCCDHCAQGEGVKGLRDRI